MTKTQKFMTLDDLKDEYIGKPGTPDRDQYEFDLKLDILGDMIKQAREKRNLTQEQLGDLVGVGKSEISKLEKNTRNMTISTILKIFRALQTNVKFIIEFENSDLNTACNSGTSIA